jgi:hypothetical protein
MFGGLLIALLVASLPLAAQNPAAQPSSATEQDKQNEQDAPAAKLTFDGEAALLTVAIRPEKTADFECIVKVARRLEAIRRSANVRGRRRDGR